MPLRILHIVDTLAVGGLQNGLANLIERLDAAHFDHVLCAMRPVEEAKGAALFRQSANRGPFLRRGWLAISSSSLGAQDPRGEAGHRAHPQLGCG